MSIIQMLQIMQIIRLIPITRKTSRFCVVKGYTTLRKTQGSSSMAREYTTLGKTHKNSKGPVSPIESLRPV